MNKRETFSFAVFCASTLLSILYHRKLKREGVGCGRRVLYAVPVAVANVAIGHLIDFGK
jgi:hypothetical protein